MIASWLLRLAAGLVIGKLWRQFMSRSQSPAPALLPSDQMGRPDSSRGRVGRGVGRPTLIDIRCRLTVCHNVSWGLCEWPR